MLSATMTIAMRTVLHNKQLVTYGMLCSGTHVTHQQDHGQVTYLRAHGCAQLEACNVPQFT